MPMVTLRPGELYIAWEPTVITTLLGSCISVVLHVPKAGITAACHAMLPSQGEHDEGGFRYVDTSLEYMFDALKIKHLGSSSLKAKLFGGADVTVKLPSGSHSNESIGELNIQAARTILARHNIVISSEKVGGIRGYRLYIRSDTAQVVLRHIANSRIRNE